MKKAVVSFAIGNEFLELLDIARKPMSVYAQVFGYDLIIPSLFEVGRMCDQLGWDVDRPASWLKVPILQYLLKNGYDLVQWFDADTVIRRFDKDIAYEFSVANEEYVQALVYHKDKYEGEVPNCGVWCVKKSATRLLDEMWRQNDLIHHKWWEQAANIRVMEQKPEISWCFQEPFAHNIHKNDVRFLNGRDWDKEGVVFHATMWPNRKEKMLEWVN
jgi:hypothetical protein